MEVVHCNKGVKKRAVDNMTHFFQFVCTAEKDLLCITPEKKKQCKHNHVMLCYCVYLQATNLNLIEIMVTV